MWWGVGAIAILVLWFGRGLIVGAVTPVNITGKHLLKQTLKRSGIDLPDACLAEFADHAVKQEKTLRDFHLTNGEGKYEYIVKSLEVDAAIITSILKGTVAKLDFHPTLLQRYIETLRRHGLATGDGGMCKV